MVLAHKTDWDLKLPLVVHGHNNLEKKTIKRNCYFLVFVQIAVQKIEMDVETHQVMAIHIKN